MALHEVIASPAVCGVAYVYLVVTWIITATVYTGPNDDYSVYDIHTMYTSISVVFGLISLIFVVSIGPAVIIYLQCYSEECLRTSDWCNTTDNESLSDEEFRVVKISFTNAVYVANLLVSLMYLANFKFLMDCVDGHGTVTADHPSIRSQASSQLSHFSCQEYDLNVLVPIGLTVALYYCLYFVFMFIWGDRNHRSLVLGIVLCLWTAILFGLLGIPLLFESCVFRRKLEECKVHSAVLYLQSPLAALVEEYNRRHIIIELHAL